MLGRMLTEILDTRVMVKQSMKIWKDDPVSVIIFFSSITYKRDLMNGNSGKSECR